MGKMFRKYLKRRTAKKVVEPVLSIGVITTALVSICSLLGIELEEAVIGGTVTGLYAIWRGVRNWWKHRND